MSDKNPKNILVKSSQWQAVRKSLLGQWKDRPEWCCSQLRKYLGSITGTSNDKIKVVQNYLVGSGFRMGKITHPCITRLRVQLSMELVKLDQELRAILYQNSDCNVILTEFERVLKLYNIEYEVDIIDCGKAIIIDIQSFSQYIKIKNQAPSKIFQIIPLESQLQKFSSRTYFNKKTKKYCKGSINEIKKEVNHENVVGKPRNYVQETSSW